VSCWVLEQGGFSCENLSICVLVNKRKLGFQLMKGVLAGDMAVEKIRWVRQECWNSVYR